MNPTGQSRIDAATGDANNILNNYKSITRISGVVNVTILRPFPEKEGHGFE